MQTLESVGVMSQLSWTVAPDLPSFSFSNITPPASIAPPGLQAVTKYFSFTCHANLPQTAAPSDHITPISPWPTTILGTHLVRELGNALVSHYSEPGHHPQL